MAAMAYVNKGGGQVPEGRAIMKEIALLCIEYHIDLRAEHIAGKLNVGPDALSRGKGKVTTCDYMFARFQELNDEPHVFDAAADKQGCVAQPGCVEWCAPGRDTDFLLHWRRACGRRIWCCPPFEMVAEFMEAVEKAWSADETTSCTMLVPLWAQKRWYRRARCRFHPVWRLVKTFDGSEQLCWRGEAQRRRNVLGKASLEPIWAEAFRWQMVALAFP